MGTRSNRLGKAANYLLKSGAKEKHKLNPVGPSNRQEAHLVLIVKRYINAIDYQELMQ